MDSSAENSIVIEALLASPREYFNGILQGYVKTARIDQVASDTSKRKGITVEQAIADIEKEIPMGHMATTEELARSIIFLGSEMSEYVTGAMLPVDGGILRSIG